MLKQLDVAIAVTVVLLGISMLVTILVQMVSAVLNLRGKHLEAGLVTLLKSIDPNLKDDAETIVGAVLRHPLVSDSVITDGKAKIMQRLLPDKMKQSLQRATAIRLDEFKAMLHQLAAVKSETGAGEEAWRTKLRTALAADPSHLLARSQVVVDDLSKGLPQNAADKLRSHAQALAAGVAGTEAKIDAWFEASMNRVSQRFSLNIRVWTATLAVAVAILMHFDALDLYNRVSQDDTMRDKLVQLADKMTPPPTAGSLEQLQQQAAGIRQRLSVAEYELTVPSIDAQKQFFVDIVWHRQRWRELLGVLIGAALLSLGSPFWFNALKGMVSLRTSVADAIDDEKKTKNAAAQA